MFLDESVWKLNWAYFARKYRS